MSDGDRVYGEREAKALLARAVELSRPPAEEEPRQGGLTLAEIERIAAEAGLDPLAVRRAAAEAPSSPRKAAAALFGPVRLVEAASLAEAPSDRDLGLVLMDLPDAAGVSGSGNVAGGCLVWRSDGASEMNTGRKVRIEVRSSPGGGATVEARSDLTPAAGGLYGGLIGGLGVGVGVGAGVPIAVNAGSPWLAALIALGAIGLGYGAARAIMAALVADAKRKGRAVVDSVRGKLEALRRRDAPEPRSASGPRPSSESRAATEPDQAETEPPRSEGRPA